MPPIKLTDAKIDRLRREVVPFLSGNQMRRAGMPVVGNPDPVLIYLAQKGEEAYRILERNEPSVYAARQVRDSRILSMGGEIIPGDSGTEEAKILHDFTVAAVKNITHWPAVKKRMLDAIYWGWRPMEVVYQLDFKHKRTTYWAPKGVKEKNPERFRFTYDRHLAYRAPQDSEWTIFNGPEDEFKWLVCTYGSTDNPYGEALYRNIWLLQYAKSRMFESFTRGMERSMGTLKVRHGFNRPAGKEEVALASDARSTSDVISSITSEISDMLSVFHNHNILLETGQYTTEFLTQVSFADGWVKAMQFVEDAMSLLVAGEKLSFQEPDHGSRAQAVVHDRSGNRVALLDAQDLDGWISDLFGKICRLNFADPDPRAIPKHRSNIRIHSSLNDAKIFVDMGGILDGAVMAKQHNLPLPEGKPEQQLKAKVKKTGPGRKSVDDSDDAVREEDEDAGRKSRQSD